ncbi:CRTAC1 family protein [Candidatus Pelagibacter sp.]|nr:CRTAC1 family protein [Candidatus Pelagibacter sp.]
MEKKMETKLGKSKVLFEKMLIKKIKNFFKYLILFLFIILTNNARAEFFEDLSKIIENNEKRLSYGISVTDFNMDGNYEFLVTGFGFANLALSYQDGKLKDLNQQKIFSDASKKTIGVAACDIDKDGFEEIYFLNTDTYSGVKKYSDRLLDIKGNNYFDLFELEKNKENLNLTAGRSVVCVDRKGDGEYGIYVANYGGPTRFYEIENELIKDKAENLNLDNITGGRAVVSGHILTERADIFAANERGANFLFKNNNGNFDDVAFDYRLDDAIQNGRGTALSDIYYRGRLDILSGNWLGYHRAWVLENNEFKDIGNKDYDEPSRIRTIISADFDNDGFDEVFMNNIAEPNKLFRIKDNGKFEQINLKVGLEANGYGTGAAVADIDNDGILELLVSRGESKAQTLTLYKAKVNKGSKYLRVKPLNKYGAPARGATVTLITNQRKHSKTIDAGSGYLCQMEPVAHYGIRKKEKNFKVEIRWTDGSKEMIDIKKLNQTVTIRQK